jgi:hypothetical protein
MSGLTRGERQQGHHRRQAAAEPLYCANAHERSFCLRGLSVSDRVDDQTDVCAIPVSRVLAEECQRGVLRLDDHELKGKGKDDAARMNGHDAAETP